MAETDTLTEIPSCYVKMDLVLNMLDDTQCKYLEKNVLALITRDFYVAYEKTLAYTFKLKNKTEERYKYTFYSRPSDKEQIAYRLGLYMQVLCKFITKDDLLNQTHKLPDGFPDCIRIETNKKS
jgi:hypothetical protein